MRENRHWRYTAMQTDLLEIVDLAIENERQMARYYRAMEDLIPAHKSTWDLLAAQEESHAAALMRMREVVAKRPFLFTAGRFQAATVRRMMHDVSAMIEDIQGGKVNPQYALTFAGDVEQSLLESRLDEIATTTLPEVLETLQQLSRETAAHRDLLRGVAI